MIVVGAGRVGTALNTASQEAGEACTLVSRDAGWESLEGPPGTPILLAIRNDAMHDVVMRVPRRRLGDLVFVQNGMIRPWLRERGLGNCTRGLLYFAVARRGDPITAGRDSVLCGANAHEVVRWLVAIGVPAQEADWGRFSAAEVEKLLWIAIFGVLCDRFDQTVGEVVRDHRDAIVQLSRELFAVCRASTGVDMPLAYLVQRLCDYSCEIRDFRASVKEWNWRNGWLETAALEFGRSTVFHQDLVRAIGKGDLLPG